MLTSAFRAPLLWYFTIGALVIIAVKLAVPGLPGATVAAAIAASAVALKCWGHWNERGGGASWASDEVYYLGLLYTLISLILAIIQLFVLAASDAGYDSLRERTDSLIGNFGIALTSTVAGILGRILLQGRGTLPMPQSDRPTLPSSIPSTSNTSPVDDSNFESSLIWDVREQLLALRRNLFEASDSFAHFTRVTLEQAEGTRASTEQVIAGFNERLAETAQAEIQALATNWRNAIAEMRTEHEAVVGQAKRELLGLRQRWTGLSKQAETELERLTERFDKAATDALQRTEAGWSKLATTLAKSAETTQASSKAHSAELGALLKDLNGLRQQLKPFGTALSDAGVAIAALHNAARESTIDSGGLGQVLQDTHQTLLTLNDTAKRVDADLISRVAEMAKAHRALTDGCTNLIADVDALCRTALESNADRAQETAAAYGQAVRQADSFKEKMEGLANTLDTQLDRAERNTAEFESLLEDVLRSTQDQAVRHPTARDTVAPSGNASPKIRLPPQQGMEPPIEPKAKSWWKFNQGTDSS